MRVVILEEEIAVLVQEEWNSTKMDFTKTGFKRLSYDNYETWKLRARQILTREKLWSCISEETPELKDRTKEWKEKDELALQSIGFLVEDAQLRLIKDAETAREAWNLLNRYYVKDSAVGKVALIKKLCKLELSEGGDCRQHLAEFDELFERFENVGCVMPEDMRAAFILASLPQSYDSMVASIQGRAEVFTMAFVKSKLLEEYERRVDKNDNEENQKAMAAKTNFKHPKEDNRRLCYACGSPDHMMRNCEALRSIRNETSKAGGRRRVEAAKAVNSEDEPRGHVCFAALQEEANEFWYLDSGASCHMTGSKNLLDSCETMKEQKVLMADGKAISCDTRGKAYVPGEDYQGHSIVVSLKDVVVVPGLSANLVSVQAITKNGFSVVFSDKNCQIMKGEKTVVVGKKVGMLYRLNKVE